MFREVMAVSNDLTEVDISDQIAKLIIEADQMVRAFQNRIGEVRADKRRLIKAWETMTGMRWRDDKN